MEIYIELSGWNVAIVFGARAVLGGKKRVRWPEDVFTHAVALFVAGPEIVFTI